ncbi:MAG TPA: hypothetical protein VJ476_00640 [Rhizomicrobium sp.]|nr:hypothetical protein [Rhizomicrobium sp.]
MNFNLKAAAAGAVLSLGALALSTGAASAYIVCNADGDCWHTHDQYTYPDQSGIIVHEDNWAWHDGDKYRWHEHDGRGFWRSGIWVTF